ncbi:MAG: hypothetical protein ACE145_09500 [Terriglobia bacterium]
MNTDRVRRSFPAGAPTPGEGAASTLRTSNAPPVVEVQIDELVLYGFDPRHRHRIGDAVECELKRLFEGGAQGITCASAVEVSRLDAGTLSAAPDATPASLGALLAQTVFRAMTR